MCNDAVRRLHYYVNNPSAWEDGFNQNVSDAIERALATHPADGDSPAVPSSVAESLEELAQTFEKVAEVEHTDSGTSAILWCAKQVRIEKRHLAAAPTPTDDGGNK